MGKFLTKFETLAEYATAQSSLLKPNVSLIAETNKPQYIILKEPKLFDYLYVDLSFGAKDATKTAIGICVIPSGVLPDGKARFMSLKDMSFTSPNEGGSDDTDMYWGGYNSDIAALTNYNTVVTGNTWYGTLFKDGSYLNAPHIPSPFDSFSEYSSAGATSDLDGKENTEKILAVDNAASTAWQTASTITNTYTNTSKHPAAQCCWRFNPGSTNQGDWYLPSAGELGFIMPNFSELQTAINDVNGVELGNFNKYWSSTEGDMETAWAIRMNDDTLLTADKDTKGSVRAFLAL